MKSCPSCQAETDDQARFCLECGFAFETAAAQPADPWQGRMVAGRFRIVRKLGDGGMGEVFLAEQVPMGRSVAVKVLRQSLSDDPEQVARFKREAQAASQLQHPNTIIVHDFGQDADGTLFIAMEFLEGHPLDAVLEEQGTIEPERAARIMTQVCASLNEAHARGMVHRDLKPENIFLVDRGTPDFVKVLDFGIAKVTQSSKGEKLESITRAGAVFGTPHYMAPEQIRGEELDARADVYALGVILYRMIAGHLPFEASTVMEMLTKHLTAEPAPIQRDGGRGEPAARARLEAVALRALCKQPDQRQPSALAFVEDIMAALPGITFNSITGLTPLAAGVGAAGIGAPDIALPPVVVDDAAPREESSGGKGLLIGLLVLLLAGGAAAGWWFMGQNGGGPDGAGGTPAVLGQGTEGGGDEGGGDEGGDEKPAEGGEQAAAGDEKPAEGGEQAAAGDEKPAAGDEKPAEGDEKPVDGDEKPVEAAAAGGEGGEGGEAAGDGDGDGAEATEGAAGEKIDEAEAARIATEAAKAEAEAAKEKAAAEAEKARVAADEQAKAAAAEKQAAEAAKAKAESEKAEAEAARAKAEAEKAAAEEAAAQAKAKEIQATAGRKQAEAAAALARANRLKAEAAAARAKAEAERMRAEMARLEVARVAAERARVEAETAREAAEAKALEAETRRAEAAEQRKAAKKGRRAAAFGTVKVITQTQGAKVKINGTAAAVTPTGPIKLQPGRHVIEVIKDGKRVSKTITVNSGKQIRVSFSL